MAGDWIKMTKDLADKPEVRRLARSLGVTRHDIVGRLHAIWSWADTHSLSGSGMDISEEDIDDIADLNGFAIALRQVGWLSGRTAALEFPHFDRHNGQTAKRRAQESLRKNYSRNKSAQDADKCPHEKQTGSGLEKRREENNNIGDNEAYSKPPLPKSSDEVKAFLIAETSSGRVSLLPAQIDQAALLFFNDMESSGWIDAKSRPVNNWQAAVRAFAMRFVANQKPLSTNKPKSRRDDLWESRS